MQAGFGLGTKRTGEEQRRSQTPSDLMRLVPPLRGKFNKLNLLPRGLAWMGGGSKVHSEVVPQALVIPSEICSPLLDYPQLKEP